MSENKWTPGPWDFGPATNYSGYYIAPRGLLPTLGAVEDGKGIHVFNFPGKTEANARLIAAAPELAEALENLTRVYSSSYSRDVRETAWDKARAALTKARGDAA